MSADTEGIVAYGATAHTMAAEMAAASAGAAGANPALLGPVMGLIGGDFMAAYAAAHAGHVAAIGQLSAVLTSVGGAATGAAVVLEETDQTNATSISNADAGLDG
ncbi:type VII secretion target [Nocardia sp. KC 131]|uniref:type VII secretion target n=1 Tax=Nocardia arseniciresistens TaxID=3392119 RepID=UPI00398E3A04